MACTPLEKDIIVELNPTRVKSAPVWLVQQWENRARTCFITLERDGEEYLIPDDYIAVLHYKKQDKKEIVKYLVIENNSVRLEFDEQMTACSGTAVAQIVFINHKDDVKLRTPLMYFNIVPGMDQGRIKSISQFSILNKTMDKIRETFVALPEIDKMVKRAEEAHANARTAIRNANAANAKADDAIRKSEKLQKEMKKATAITKDATEEAKKAAAHAHHVAHKGEKFMVDAKELYIRCKDIDIKPKKKRR